MARKIANYLNDQASVLLSDEPFKDWRVEKSVETDLERPIIFYSFPEHGFELRCDHEENISSIFISRDDFDGFSAGLLDISISWNREQVRMHYGTVSRSGERMTDTVLGEYGAWDRFSLPGYVVHVEYRTDSDHIKKITLMREESVPYAAFP